MGRHIIQKWYEFTISYRENDRYGWDWQLVIENDDRYGWDYRLVIENDSRYGWDCRLVIENDDRYGPKNINWQLRAGKDWKQAGTSSEIIHSCLHQVASQFSRHFGEKHGVEREHVLWWREENTRKTTAESIWTFHTFGQRCGKIVSSYST